MTLIVLEDHEIGIPCSKCGHRTRKSIRWIRRNREFTCLCGSTIKLKPGQLSSEIALAERMYKNPDLT